MPRTLEFFFDYGSPYSYLASTQVEAVAKRTDARLLWRPMLLGMDPQASFQRMLSSEIKERLRRNTDEAVSRGAFGAPTFFVGEDMFFGNDRFAFVEAALQR